jgi:hypothetical protein
MKIMYKVYLCLVVLCAVVSLSPMALAQQTATPELPTAKDLAFLIGKWETNIVVKATEITPKGTTGKGVAEYHLFGQAIEGSRASETSNGHNEDRELVFYANVPNSYEMITVNLKGMCTQRKLTRHGDSWEVEYNGRMNNKDFRVRGTYKIVSDDELQYSTEVDIAKSGFKPFSEVTFRRVPKK